MDDYSTCPSLHFLYWMTLFAGAGAERLRRPASSLMGLCGAGGAALVALAAYELNTYKQQIAADISPPLVCSKVNSTLMLHMGGFAAWAVLGMASLNFKVTG
jgi:hypothetical protein